MSGHEDVPRITLMPDALTLIRVPKSNLDICTKPLIRLAFFNHSYVIGNRTLEIAWIISFALKKGLFMVSPKFQVHLANTLYLSRTSITLR